MSHTSTPMSNILARVPHLQDFIFVLFASQLGIAVQPGPKTQKFLRQTFVAPILIFCFIMLKNAQYTSREAMVVGVGSLVAFYIYKMLP
ncbi:hypothetical protein WJX74_000420 [Apatococcus lobatus]|uniref:Uncharacterized protein n=1 Tax=Apatococcus lobatus TaxID=904363 RepID=A0AAW1QZQ7_9CHLO